MNNPIDGIVPDFAIFGAEFTELWQKIFAGLWGLAVVVTIVFLILGITKMAQSSSSNPQGYKEGRTSALWAGIALGLLVALGVIVGAIIAIFG